MPVYSKAIGKIQSPEKYGPTYIIVFLYHIDYYFVKCKIQTKFIGEYGWKQ